MDNPKVKLKGQASLEFVVTFVMLVLFVALVARIFAWFGARIVSRQEAYEATRNATVYTTNAAIDFFDGHPGNVTMDVFNENH
jgi:uncharacterized protein (UPF0333 family)